jgi:hypothetical protein
MFKNLLSTTRQALIPLGLAILATSILAGCVSTSAPNEDLPKVTDEGLHLKKGTKSSALYVLPDADLAQYNRFAIAEVRVAFRDDWLKDQNTTRRAHRVTQKDADEIKSAVSEQFSKIFTEELRKGGYTVVDLDGVDNSAQDLLLLRPAIINLDVTAPDTMTAGRSRTFTASAGSMTLLMGFYDAVSGSLLAQVVDAEAAHDMGHMQISNSVTNMADANRIFRKWAKILVEKTDAAHAK